MNLPLSVRLRVALQQWQRRRLRKKYGDLFDEIAAIFFRHDPVGVKFEDNANEYEPEVGTVLPRLKECRSPSDVRRVLHQEFSRWFTPAAAGQKIATTRRRPMCGTLGNGISGGKMPNK